MSDDRCITPHRLVGSLGEIIHDPASCEACGGQPAPAAPVSGCAECGEPGWSCQCPTDDIPESRDERPEPYTLPPAPEPLRLMSKRTPRPRTRPVTPGIIGRLVAILDSGVLVYADPEKVSTG